jgi:hypothetical protein
VSTPVPGIAVASTDLSIDQPSTSKTGAVIVASAIGGLTAMS